MRSPYYRGGSTSIGNIRCDVCGDLSNGWSLCVFHRERLVEHAEGEHSPPDPDCPECLLVVE